jgi:hypothetical protein
MTVSELIEQLIDACDGEPENTEVRLMTQPSWPFEWSIAGVSGYENPTCETCDGIGKVESDLDGETEKCQDCEGKGDEPRGKDFDGDASPTGVVFVLEGSQLRYGDKNAWDRS